MLAFFFFLIARKNVSTSASNEEFEYVQQATHNYLDQEPIISSSVDGKKIKQAIQWKWWTSSTRSAKVFCGYWRIVLLTIRVRLAMPRATRKPWSLGSSATTMLELVLIFTLWWSRLGTRFAKTHCIPLKFCFHALGMQPISSYLWEWRVSKSPSKTRNKLECSSSIGIGQRVFYVWSKRDGIWIIGGPQMAKWSSLSPPSRYFAVRCITTRFLSSALAIASNHF